jgi:hypothetical protein
MLSSWVHLLALSVYLGSLVGLWSLILSPLPTIQNHKDQAEFLARSLKVYNPLQIGALGLLVLTGAAQITDLKAVYRELFASELGATLVLKLSLSFVVILLSTYQSMGVAHRFVKRCEGEDPVAYQEVQSLTRRLRYSTLIILLLTFITVLVGTMLLR